MLAVSRFRVAGDDSLRFREDVAAALAALSGRSGFRDATLGRATDDPTLWVLVTEWQHVGAYRRAFSAYDVRVAAAPMLNRGIDEPTAYETILGEGATEPNEVGSRGEYGG
jgi:heme-degrading monooxygenase HmoA